jgi:hypothetical protein
VVWASEHSLVTRRWAAWCVAAALVASCGKKSSGPPPEVTGLAAVPSTAEVVVGADVARVAASPLVARAVDQLLLRDGGLASSWQKVQTACKLDPAQIEHVVLAIGPHPGPAPGTGPVLMVATGKQLSETQLVTCVRGLVGQGSGSVEVKDADGRTLYVAKDGNRVVYFSFSRADTVVLGTDEAFVRDAIGTGKKALDNPDLARWIELSDQRAPMWAAGHVDPRVAAHLPRITNGQISSGPVALALTFDPTSGAKLALAVVMANPQDAKALESFANANKGLLGYAAQAKSLGPVVDKLKIAVDGAIVRFSLDLTLDDVNQVISALDGKVSAAQDSPPAK